MDPIELHRPTPELAPIPLKHSGLGIASFVLAIVSLLGYIASVALIGAKISPYLNGEGLPASSEELFQIVGGVVLLALLFVLLNVIGFVLGIIGVVLKNRMKIFAIFGLIMNGVIVLCLALLFIIIVINATI
ncbi:hypothetical protein ACP8HI_02595 [Paenibacillus sp. FA6]|uniref:hypothetical protein n=1 Tax=Paenibacillus sp. FA6 TaxID=3413029 RepID=UPI003F656BC0